MRVAALFYSLMETCTLLDVEPSGYLLEAVKRSRRNREDVLTPMAWKAELAQAASYHIRNGGSRIRGQCALHAGVVLGLSEPDAVCIAAAAELLHNASLVHDDLQDHTTVRRGAPTVWKKYGPDIAICTGDFLLSLAYSAVCGMSNSSVIAPLVSAMHERTELAAHGQCQDLDATDRSLANLATYLEIVIAKSGALLSLPLELAFIASGKGEWVPHAREAAEAFAVSYQIADDLFDHLADKESQSMNVLSVFESAGHGVKSKSRAQTLAREHLEITLTLANSLPLGSGRVLIDAALALKPTFESGAKQ